MYQDSDGWLQVPRHLLLVGIQVKERDPDKVHPVKQGRHVFKIYYRGTCELYTEELPEFIRVTPTWCDSERGYTGLTTPSKPTSLRHETIQHDLQLFHDFLDRASSQRTDLAKMGVHEGLLDYMDTRMKDGLGTFFPKVRALWCKANHLVLTVSIAFKGAGTYELFKD
ncbi:hypothetical protein CMUS01_08930 [Colletotrichum musicola]|uniref:Uncharacterized protein n=1 Tax=Colletotrichum musicola TaxID=2175873 RepID=A0A8H6KAJ9_9PEZI|nr:hypothetical protein CMUS01_08930 [Colletotrichum musicola]